MGKVLGLGMDEFDISEDNWEDKPYVPPTLEENLAKRAKYIEEFKEALLRNTEKGRESSNGAYIGTSQGNPTPRKSEASTLTDAYLGMNRNVRTEITAEDDRFVVGTWGEHPANAFVFDKQNLCGMGLPTGGENKFCKLEPFDEYVGKFYDESNNLAIKHQNGDISYANNSNERWNQLRNITGSRALSVNFTNATFLNDEEFATLKQLDKDLRGEDNIDGFQFYPKDLNVISKCGYLDKYDEMRLYRSPDLYTVNEDGTRLSDEQLRDVFSNYEKNRVEYCGYSPSEKGLSLAIELEQNRQKPQKQSQSYSKETQALINAVNCKADDISSTESSRQLGDE